jgi:aminoglycoside phosphotransferase (APT) family kinase protein
VVDAVNSEPPDAGRRLPGLDLDVIAGWFTTTVPDAAPPRSASLIAGGRSNLTYEVTDGIRNYILRRPPLGHVLATAHDVGREYRVIAALGQTEVPVPRVFGLCQDPSLLGAPFYVMEKVDGDAFRTAAQLADQGTQQVATISRALVTTLARLHSIAPSSIGLTDFGRPVGFLPRQVRRWTKQLQASATRPLRGAEELSDRLTREVPEQGESAIVHGDYRVDNVLFHDGQPTAVLDWEMATLGDPATDVALLLAYQRMAELPGGAAVFDAHSAPGFLSAAELIDTYTSEMGRPFPQPGFYLALAFFKMATICESIHHRYAIGQTVGEGFDTIGDVVEPLLDSGLDALDNRSLG